MSFDLISLALSVPTILLSALVVILWTPTGVKFLKAKGPRSATDWFAFGIAAGFLGETLDNGYWTLAWTANYLDDSLAEWLIFNGPAFNIFFRQSFTTLAAFAHIKAYLIFEDTEARFWKGLSLSSLTYILIISGILFAWFLTLAPHG